jgi:regulation of enolase protein 1 (concanavalin A-like superfamily)
VTDPDPVRGWRAGWAPDGWLNPPPRVQQDAGDLLVTAEEGSDFWRVTSYGVVHDSGHALLAALPDTTAVEATFVCDLTEQFDQAGVLVRADAEHWVKAGVECSDGVLQLGAVVTDGRSDWSVAPVPDWAGRAVTVRASRSGDALTVRARVEDEPWRLVRVAPLSAGPLQAGLLCCAPTRAGLTVRFTDLRLAPADAALHG